MIKNFCILFLALLSFSSLALSAEDKNVVVDQAIGGMEQGRRISAPGNYSNTGFASGNSRSVANPVTDAHAHPFMQMTGNRGYMYSNAGANGPQNASTGTSPSQAGSPIPPTAQTTNAGSIMAETGTSQPHTGTEVTGSTAGTAQTVTQQTGGSANAGTQAGQTVTEQVTNPSNAGSSSASSNPIVGVQAGTNPGSNIVHNASVTTQPVTGTTGQTVPEQTGGSVNVNTGEEAHGNGGILTGGETSTVNAPTGTTTQEPSGTSGTSSNPIVSVEAGTNPASGTPNASVHTDTSGQLEDRQIVSAGVTGAVTGSSGTQVGSASEITGSNAIHNANVTTQPVTGTNIGTGETHTVGSSGATTQEPSGTSSNPIVSVEAGTNPSSGTAPNAAVHTDTSGQLEDRQIVSAGVAGAGTGSTGAQAGSASEITGSNTVHNTNITTEPVTGTTGQTVTQEAGINIGTGETHTVGSSGATTQEPSGTSSNPIVSVEAGKNPESGTPNAIVHVDTSGQLEDRQIVGAGVAGAGTSSSGTQVGSASAITGSSAVHNADITTQPVTSTTGQTVPEQTGGSVTTETENHGYIMGQAGTVETNPVGSPSIGGTQEPSGTSGTSSNPIVSVEAGTNPSSGTPTTSVHTDTSGQLEDRQIVDAGVTGQAGSTQVEEGSATDVTGQELVHEADITTEAATSTTGQTTPEQIGAGSGTTVQEPSGTSGASSNPIVGVEAGTNPESGVPNVGTSVDTTGELEDKQFLQTDLASEGVTSTGQVGSASDITGSSAVHGADITTQPQTGSGSSGTTTQEPSGTSSNPIVSVEAGKNPESGTPNVSVHTDTSGQLEDRQIVDAGITGQAGSSGTQVGSASAITGSGTVGSLDVTTQPVESVIPAPSDMSAEVDTTGQTVGGSADVGVQADSSGVSDTSDVAKKDAADGLNLGTTVHTGL